MGRYVTDFQAIDQTQVADVGGKGAHLGELSRIEGIRIPAGFCVTTSAFRRVMAEASSLDDGLDRLSRLKADDREAIRTISADIRRTVEAIAIPDDLAAAILHPLARLGEQGAYAVRSSATAEDLPEASFAGQHDSYLNVVGPEAILQHISRCWASLFTERAVTYRLRNGIDHRQVDMAVVVQQMVVPQASGILFTADPVTGNRKVASIDAAFGLGEALVSGHVNADVYKVRAGALLEKKVANLQAGPALTDEQILELDRLGRAIESHFGAPQDVEWCLAAGAFSFVQARPITTLYPIPEANDTENHVYLSVGHQQMMTDPMKPLGLSFFQLTAAGTMVKAGGRLFVDAAPRLATTAGRKAFLAMMAENDLLTKDALLTLIERGDVLPDPSADQPPASPVHTPPVTPIDDEPALVASLIENLRRSTEAVKRAIQAKSGADVFDFIREDVQDLKKAVFDPRSMAVIMAGMGAATWLNENLKAWLGEDGVVDVLSRSAPHNVTAEMGLALLDVADAIRPHPEVVAFLQGVKVESFLAELDHLAGGRETRVALQAFLEQYGMRCIGEIDLTRPRWSEKPSTLLPILLANVKNFGPGASRQKFEQGRQEAHEKAEELLTRLKALPDGDRKALETQQKIATLRNLIGYREYPKYGIVSRYQVYREAILKEADALLHANVIQEREDIDYLTFDELHEVVRTHVLDLRLVRERKAEHQRHEKLTPPRVITSEGEVLNGRYQVDHLPDGALAGLGVSSGAVEGRARVILRLEDAELEEGDILVTTFTDPSWTPLFVSIRGLVTEVGGMNTHGAVIAREYGLPAVVGVALATRLIRDGQRIRVNGTDGNVEILS